MFFAADGHCCAATARTAADGTYVARVNPGQYKLLFYPPVASGLASSFWPNLVSIAGALPVTIGASGSLQADMALPPGVLVSGSVKTAQGQPFADGRIIVNTTSFSIVSETATTDAAGAIAIRLTNGVYLIDIYPPGTCCAGAPLRRLTVTVSGTDVNLGTVTLP